MQDFIVVAWNERGSLVEFMRCTASEIQSARETLIGLAPDAKIVVYQRVVNWCDKCNMPISDCPCPF
jgi:hypothetical protein